MKTMFRTIAATTAAALMFAVSSPFVCVKGTCEDALTNTIPDAQGVAAADGISEQDTASLPFTFEEFLSMDDQAVMEKLGIDEQSYEQACHGPGGEASYLIELKDAELLELIDEWNYYHSHKVFKEEVCSLLNLPKEVVRGIGRYDFDIGETVVDIDGGINIITHRCKTLDITPENEKEFQGYTGRYVAEKLCAYLQLHPAVAEVHFDYVGWSDFVPSGDVDLDGRISLLDVIALQRYLLNVKPLGEEGLADADLDQNGTVDIFDLALLKRKLLTK